MLCQEIFDIATPPEYKATSITEFSKVNPNPSKPNYLFTLNLNLN